MIVAAAPAFAKGDLVQIGVSGGDLRREIRIPASNRDLTIINTTAPAEMPAVRYVLVFHLRLGSEIRASGPSWYFSGTRPLLHHADPDLPDDNWYEVGPPLADILDRAIAAARAGRYTSARPVGVTVTSWPLVASWAGPLACAIVIVTRRNALKNARRLAGAAPA